MRREEKRRENFPREVRVFSGPLITADLATEPTSSSLVNEDKKKGTGGKEGRKEGKYIGPGFLSRSKWDGRKKRVFECRRLMNMLTYAECGRKRAPVKPFCISRIEFKRFLPPRERGRNGAGLKEGGC